MSAPEQRHVVIVGGGVIALASAYELLQRGCAVTVVERSGPEHDGASLGNAGMIVPSHVTPLAAPGMIGVALKSLLDPAGPIALRPRLDATFAGWLWRFWRAATPVHVARCAPVLRDLHLRSRELLLRFGTRHGNDFDLTSRGLLVLCRQQRTLDHEAAAAERADALGVPAQVLDRTALTALEPAALDVAGGVLFPLDAHLAPQRFVAALMRTVAALGARFVWNTEVSAFRSDGERLRAAITRAGDIDGDAFVLAAGLWSSGLVRSLGLRLPLEAGKGYSMTLPQPRRALQRCSILAEARVAVTPMGGLLRIGGTLELGAADAVVRRRRVDGIRRAFTRCYTDFRLADFDAVEVWSGLRPCSPDGMPYLGRSRAKSNLVIATGHAMMGVSLAAVSGEIVAQLVAGETPTIDLRLLDPDRYAG